jgi:hypothetical protein
LLVLVSIGALVFFALLWAGSDGGPARAKRPPGFRDLARESGLGFKMEFLTNEQGEKFKINLYDHGCGVVVGDYNGDGHDDLFFLNQLGPNALYRNRGDGTFEDVTEEAGVALADRICVGGTFADYDNDGDQDLYITTTRGGNVLFQNRGDGTFEDVTRSSGLDGRTSFSTSALWFDFDRDGWLDLFVCNYVRWSPELDVFCTADGAGKAYCTPEAYRGETCWLFRNNRDGTFEDVTATSGIFDTSSKSLGVAMFDYDQDGWPDLLVANDTQPNKLYRNMRDGTFREAALESGLALSAEGKARAGMGVDVGDFDNSGTPGVAITNFDNEMIGLYRALESGLYEDVAIETGVGRPSQRTLGFGCAFFDADLDGRLDLAAVNGHIDDAMWSARNIGYAQPPHLFLNSGDGTFRDVAGDLGREFAVPRVARGLAYGDFDRDGDSDILITTNNGPAFLFRNDQQAGHRSIRFHLIGRTSNRDAIGATVRVFAGGVAQSRLVKGGSSYLSQSELPVTFGLGLRNRIDRLEIQWPNGRGEEYRNLEAGRGYQCVEGEGIEPLDGF